MALCLNDTGGGEAQWSAKLRQQNHWSSMQCGFRILMRFDDARERICADRGGFQDTSSDKVKQFVGELSKTCGISEKLTDSGPAHRQGPFQRQL